MSRKPEAVVVTTRYDAMYTDPIAFARGATVRVVREDPEQPTWWWCIGPDGREGWTPADVLAPSPAPGSLATATADYTARELTVTEGTTLVVLDRRPGWLFVRDPAGATGWVPDASIA